MRQVRVTFLSRGAYTVEIDNARGHILASDEPEDSGGSDIGPTPHELLIAALGSCVAITLRMYSDRHQWPLEDVTVDVTMDEVIPTEPEFTPEEIAAAGPSGKLPLIRSHVAIKGNLDEEQCARLEQIAGRCPVHRTLRGPVAILTSLTQEG